MKNSFIVYTENTEFLDQMTTEQVGKLYLAQISYSRGDPPDLSDPIVKLTFSMLKGQMDRDRKKWEEIRSLRSDAGRKGSDKRWQKIANDSIAIDAIANDSKPKQDMAKMAVNVNVNVKDNKEKIIKEKVAKLSFGINKKVKLTEAEYERLLADFGEPMRTQAIQYLDDYMTETPGYAKKDHNRTIRRWVIDAVRSDRLKKQKLDEEEQRARGKKQSFATAGNKRDTDYDRIVMDLVEGGLK